MGNYMIHPKMLQDFVIILELTEADERVCNAYTALFYPGTWANSYYIYSEVTNGDSRPLVMSSHQLYKKNYGLNDNLPIGIARDLYRENASNKYILTIEQLKTYLLIEQLSGIEISEYINTLFHKNEIGKYKP